MKQAIEFMTVFILGIAWLAGIALSKGAGVLAAICIPPYAWYLVVERCMKIAGLL